MVGNPKYLATRFDYNYVREHQSDWRDYWQELYDSRMIWANVAGPVIPDETHRILQSKDMEGNDIEIHQEYQVDPNAKLFRIGFTEGEVAAAIAE